jgi:hypothetical protein
MFLGAKMAPNDIFPWDPSLHIFEKTRQPKFKARRGEERELNRYRIDGLCVLQWER